MDAGDEPLVGDVQQRHSWCFVDAAALRFDDPVLDLIAHPEAVAAADGVGFADERDLVAEGALVQRDRPSLVEAHGHGLRRDGDVAAPERDAHDRLDDGDAFVEKLEILGFVRRAEDVRVGRVRLLDAHLVAEAGAIQVFRHLFAAAELVDELAIEPRLVDPQVGIGEQAVAIEALDVVALEGAAVAPDVDVVFLHRDDEHGAGDGAAERRGVEVGDAGRRDVEGAALQRGDAFGDELRAAVDQPRALGAVLQRLAGNLVVVALVGLPEVRRVGVRNRALAAHPVERGARIEAAGECDADTFTNRKRLKNVAQSTYLTSMISMASLLGPSIMNARDSPILCVGSRIFTLSPRSFANHALRSATPRPT